MVHQFRLVDRDAEMLLPHNMLDWVPDGHAVRVVTGTAGRLATRDLAGRLVPPAPAGPAAGPARQDPVMLLAVWLYAYLRGVLSARAAEDRCRHDSAFRVGCGREVPDHATFSRFGKYLFAQDGPAENLFFQVLRVCAGAGPGRRPARTRRNRRSRGATSPARIPGRCRSAAAGSPRAAPARTPRPMTGSCPAATPARTPATSSRRSGSPPWRRKAPGSSRPRTPPTPPAPPRSARATTGWPPCPGRTGTTPAMTPLPAMPPWPAASACWSKTPATTARRTWPGPARTGSSPAPRPATWPAASRPEAPRPGTPPPPRPARIACGDGPAGRPGPRRPLRPLGGRHQGPGPRGLPPPAHGTPRGPRPHMVNTERVIYRHCCNDPLSPRRSNALNSGFHGA